MTTHAPHARTVLIAGGGPAALETALALQQLAGARVAITLLTPDPELDYRPLAVAQPFGAASARSFSVTALAADRAFALRQGAVARVDPARRSVATAAGETLSYEALVLALGARPVAAVPGAMTFSGYPDTARVQGALEALRGRTSPRVAFVAGSGTAWTLPIYELALRAVAWAGVHGVALEPWLVTHEPRPLSAFGEQASREMTDLLEEAGVRLWTSASAQVVEDGRLWLERDGGLPVDFAIALPRLVGRPVPGLPHDDQGFTPVDRLGRVQDAPDVYAVGDMTARPLKQGGLTTQQSDVTATALAAWAGAAVKPAPWWPPHKIAARHLGPYLAAHPELEVRHAV